MLREKKFSGANGKLIGRPDVVRPDEVVDLKTGDVFEDDEPERVKARYVRQLRLYAFLVKETLGWWLRRGILLPMAGSPSYRIVRKRRGDRFTTVGDPAARRQTAHSPPPAATPA